MRFNVSKKDYILLYFFRPTFPSGVTFHVSEFLASHILLNNIYIGEKNSAVAAKNDHLKSRQSTLRNNSELEMLMFYFLYLKNVLNLRNHILQVNIFALKGTDRLYSVQLPCIAGLSLQLLSLTFFKVFVMHIKTVIEKCVILRLKVKKS